MKITRGHLCCAERYAFDFNTHNPKSGMCSPAFGWAQIDTAQDASYYGIWVNPFDLKKLSFIEGDTCLVECESKEEFVRQIRECKAFQDENGGGFKGIDPGFNEGAKNPWIALGLGDLLH